MPSRVPADFATRWRTQRGIGPLPPRTAKVAPLPAGIGDHCTTILTTRRAPALLALVVLGRVTPSQLEHVKHLSDALDDLYDDAEARARADRADVQALMRNDVALSQLRERRRTAA